MRSVASRQAVQTDLRRRIERLETLPLRPATARFVLGEVSDDAEPVAADLHASPRWRSITDLDPAWALSASRQRSLQNPLAMVADSAWWPLTSRDGLDAICRLWRHSVAVGLAARRIARETQDAEADRLALAGFLNGLGLWVAASLDPEWLARLLAINDPAERRAFEVAGLGQEAGALGRDLAERWGCDPLVVDAAWLHAESDRGLDSVADDPPRLAMIQKAYRLAERTPWALFGQDAREIGSHDPRVKLLTAEVQSRCGGPFLDTDVSPREEKLSRSNARLLLKVATLTDGQASRDRFLNALVESDPTDAPETWAERAALALCGEPGVSRARVLWSDTEKTPTDSEVARPPTVVHTLKARGQTFSRLQLWTDPGVDSSATILPAWQAWGALIADRARMVSRLDRVQAAYRRQDESEEPRLRLAKLDALAEFAAGAGHELNNPLAVIVGRAQLLMVAEADPKTLRSLRAIFTQAQRAHRILRDLMYVARPPEPRPRFCQPDEIVRASLRDARADADEREVKLTAEALDHGDRVWADPDGLRHLADVLIRNALEATPKGGQIRFVTAGDASAMRWTVVDSGRGISLAEGGHLFDPFYCGRQAGRGLGMGLPRAQKFVAQTGGEIRWQSTPGQGSRFHVRLPLAEAPKPIATTSEPGPVNL